MSLSIVRHCGSGSSDAGVATTAEYALLAGVSIVIFLALSGAIGAFFSASRDDATAIAAYRVALVVSSATFDAVGAGDISASMAIDLPEEICGMPYMAYPSQDGRSIQVSVIAGTMEHQYSAPLPLRGDGVHIAGFIASPPGGHEVVFDAVSRTVTLS